MSKRGYPCRSSNTRRDKLYKVKVKQEKLQGNRKLLQALKYEKHVKRVQRGGIDALLAGPIADAIDKLHFLKDYCDKQYSAMQANHTHSGKGWSSASQSYQLKVLDFSSSAQCG